MKWLALPAHPVELVRSKNYARGVDKYHRSLLFREHFIWTTRSSGSKLPYPEYKALARGRKLIVVWAIAVVSSVGWCKVAAAHDNDELSRAHRDWWHLLAKTKWPHRFCASACVRSTSARVCVRRKVSFFFGRSVFLFQLRTSGAHQIWRDEFVQSAQSGNHCPMGDGPTTHVQPE